jgi:hypothetical protein
MALALVAIFLASVARFYHPGTGFTALIAFPRGNTSEAPALQAIPHETVPPWGSYDGQFYAQRALDPLLRDPRVDRAMDLAPYRARRILFSWTAYLLGLGRPAWILQAFAVQNVASWLLLAFLLTRWLPLRSARDLALWSACLFSHGLLWSVRFSLLDGPSLVLTVLVVIAAERERWMLSAALAGINGLARETNILGVLAQKWPAGVREWFRLAGAALLVALPLLIWEDYLYSIYRSTIFAGTDQLTMPGSAMVSTIRRVLAASVASGLFSASVLQLGLLLSLVVQAIYLVARPAPRVPWWRIGAGYVLLMLVMEPILWSPNTGAITRVLLPLTFAFNILLVREQPSLRFWALFVGGNLHLLASTRVLW